MEQEPQVISALSPESGGTLRIQQASLLAPEEGVAVFERLEYGKLCTSPDGPIEPGVESYPLVVSAGFPKLVKDSCRPWILGVGPELAPDAPHGTVLRCLRIEGTPIQVFCRLRQRPEGGEGQPGRRFWRGLYLCCSFSNPDPLTGFMVLEKENPLRGITIKESKRALAPIEVPLQPRPESDALLDTFLPQALELVLSGIPVGVAGGVDELTFFRQATALWSLLPPPLRSLFSAGWSIPSSEAASLNLSATLQFPPSVAVFDAPRRQWRLPARVDQVQTNGELRSRPFDEDQLVPGRMFLREAFEWSNGRPCLHQLHLDHLKELDYGIAEGGPAGVLDARSGWARERFQRPGLRSLDYARTSELTRWLDGNWQGDPATLCSSTAEYFFLDARRGVMRLGLDAIHDPEKRARGEEVVWRSLVRDPSSHELLEERASAFPESVQVRAYLLRALASGSWQDVQLALDAAVEQGIALKLPAAADERLDASLLSSLESVEGLGWHCRRLSGGEIPEPYRAWAQKNACRLAVTFATCEGSDFTDALLNLRKLVGIPVVETLHRLQLREPPRDTDIQNLRGLERDNLERLASRLLILWRRIDEETVPRREKFLFWIERFGSLGEDDPLIACIFAAPDSPRWTGPLLLDLEKEIYAERVPNSLHSRVAAVALMHWERFSSDYTHRTSQSGGSAGWLSILACWPAEARIALTDMKPIKQMDQPEPEVLDALKKLQLSDEFLERRLAKQVERGSPVKLEVSWLLWKLCQQRSSRSGPISAVWLCCGIAKGALPECGATPPHEETLKLVQHFVRPLNLQPSTRELWSKAKHAWQILLLLKLFPSVNLSPSQAQLAELIPEREELGKHLKTKNIHPNRKDLFRVASANFHTLSYPADGWKNTYRDSALWGAFRGVPIPLQGDFETVLKSYGKSSQSWVDLSLDYLSRQEQPGIEEAVRRVARTVFVPLVRRGRLTPDDMKEVFEQRDPSYRRLPVFLGGTKVSYGDYDLALAKESGREILVSWWFSHLLEKIVSLKQQAVVLAELRRNRGDV
jgi:hypothetical protein